ncbi:ankyrin repeat domain-containing protein 13D isoform X3 [Coturnix japonica]|uniref:ankyrin repeat domain-containing protein 13D isoform X3 n=1 Tax=Coturnix japonica TaxID=93934 RepID=UPI0013A5DB8F|nr:ankyrin repeat domain-containing protein 13D isoform X3 [Coturnix japonica]
MSGNVRMPKKNTHTQKKEGKQTNKKAVFFIIKMWKTTVRLRSLRGGTGTRRVGRTWRAPGAVGALGGYPVPAPPRAAALRCAALHRATATPARSHCGQARSCCWAPVRCTARTGPARIPGTWCGNGPRRRHLPAAPPRVAQPAPGAGQCAALRHGARRHDVELTDPRGRTPLHLATTLGHLESVRVLLRHNANVGRENANGWTVLQEAVSTGDPEIVQLVLQYRDYQRATRRLAGIPELLSKLRRASDFYVEMKWEFTSWVPLVSKVCPSDVYRVWKRGESLRVDTTLLGFEHMTWQRGRRSYIFKGEEEGAVVMEVDHDKQVVYTETLALALHEPDLLLAAMQPSEEHVAGRLTSPIVSTHLDTRNIAFERNKSGIWGWRSEKMEVVSGYEAKAPAPPSTPFWAWHSSTALTMGHPRLLPPAPPTPRPSPWRSISTHTSTWRRATSGAPSRCPARFKATLWLCEEHPLSLAEQVAPIIDLMAISNAHFAKLRDFITLKLPPGFPVKIEIPLFHVLNARITFSNLCGCDQPLGSVRVCNPTQPPGARAAGPGGWPFPCEVEPAVFEVPPGYTVMGAGRSEPLREDEDDLLQFAIQQSLLEAGSETEQVTVWEALTNARPGPRPPPYDEELQLERALQESLLLQAGPGPADTGTAPANPGYGGFAEQLRLAMALSEREQEERERRRREEDEELQRILRLSLTDK